MSDNERSATERGDQLKTSSLKEVVSDELERIGSGGKFVWTLFFLCVTPNILNGFHVSSYVFLGHMPNEMWCTLDELKAANWTTAQIRSITEEGLGSSGCTIWDWNYSNLSAMSYQEAYDFTKRNSKPPEILCSERENSHFEYDEPKSSIVSEWDLVCEKSVQRTSAQVLLSLGKFFGSFSFGILSDKYGRKTSFTLASASYILGSLLASFSPWYLLFLMGRFLLGSAASGLFYPAFALLTENISLKHRSWMSVAFSGSYPIGMLILALSAYLVEPWRQLQLTLTAPSVLLILNCYFLFESPRWLLMKNRVADAYKIVFKTKNGLEIYKNTESNKTEKNVNQNENISFIQKIKNSFKELRGLYGPRKMRRMALTCYFMWCVVSLCYYVTALNADNLSANRYLYVAFTGLVDIPSYIVPMIFLKYMGRKTSAFILFATAGASLLIVCGIPHDGSKLLVLFAMLGRFGISGVYSIVTLYTAELFPTEIRNSALGTSSTMAHIGSITAPYIVDVLGSLGWFIPTTICGCSVILAGLLMLTLPETGKRNLTDTVKDEIKETTTSE